MAVDRYPPPNVAPDWHAQSPDAVLVVWSVTDAAREAADLVLIDDNFATITRAVKEGRAVFDHIQNALWFMLPTNGGEAGVVMLAVFAGLALPVTPAEMMVAATFSVFEWKQARTAAVNLRVCSELVDLFTGNPVAVLTAAVLIGMQGAFTNASPLQEVFLMTELDTTSWSRMVALGGGLFLLLEAGRTVWRRPQVRGF